MNFVRGIIFLAIGLGFLGTIAYGAWNEAGTVAGAIELIRDIPSLPMPDILLPIIGLLFTGAGLFNMVGSVISGVRGRVLALRIDEVGIETQATVTFVDRNYSILVNNRPIYSIVECKFTDISGREHVSRKDTISSELVIRNQIEVGGTIAIKYLAEDPSQNVFLFLIRR